MSQSIISTSAASIATYRTSETVQAQGANFTVSKAVQVMSSNGADIVDLSPDAKKALQSFLSGGGSIATGNTGEAAGSGLGGEPSGDAVEISVTTATSSTIGRQPDHATASDYDISWTAADGQTGSLEVAESASFTTDQQLVPLSPQLQASSANSDPGIATSAVSITIGSAADASPASTAILKGRSGAQDTDAGKVALMMLEAGLTTLGRHGSAGQAGSSSASVPSQDM